LEHPAQRNTVHDAPVDAKPDAEADQEDLYPQPAVEESIYTDDPVQVYLREMGAVFAVLPKPFTIPALVGWMQLELLLRKRTGARTPQEASSQEDSVRMAKSSRLGTQPRRTLELVNRRKSSSQDDQLAAQPEDHRRHTQKPAQVSSDLFCQLLSNRVMNRR